MVKQWLTKIALIFVLATARFCVAADVSGSWVAVIAGPGESQYAHVELKIDGTKVSGTWGTSILAGTLVGDKLDAALTDSDGKPAGSLSGMFTGETFTGTGT